VDNLALRVLSWWWCILSADTRSALQCSVTRVNDSSHDVEWLGLDSSHAEKNGDSTRVTFFTEWLESSQSKWLETRVRVILTKSLSSSWTNPVGLPTKKWAFFHSVIIKIDANLLFCLSSRSMLYFRHQVSRTSTEGAPETLLSLSGQQGTTHYMTPYHGSIQYLHNVITAVDLKLWFWVLFFRFKANPKTIF